MLRPRFWRWIALSSWLIGAGAWAQNQKSEAEMQVRAQFVYNFANFVEWPEDAFPNAEAPIKVCLLGQVFFAPYLYSFNGSLIGERKFSVIKANELDEIRDGCHVLYVGEDERVRLPTFWKEIRYLYVLSIGDREGFSDKGGIINILRTSDRVQFDVNIENALVNGLFLDSDLLALARAIKRNTVQAP
jgi:YfiR/HmsC-like